MEERYNETYSLPTELTAEIRIFKTITARTVIILIAFLYTGTQLMNRVYEPLQPFFLIFHMIVGVLLCVNSGKNKQKRLYQSALIMLCRDKKYYKPIANPIELPSTIEEFKNYRKGVNYIEPEGEE